MDIRLQLNLIYTCILAKSGDYRHCCLGYQEDTPESTAARSVAADELNDLLGLSLVRESLDSPKYCDPSKVSVLESGSITAVVTAKQGASLSPGCLYAETLADLQTDPESCWHSLPGPPETTFQLATGLSHAILLSQSGNPGFNQVLGLGDNRHRAAMPSTMECRQPSNHLSEPKPIEDLCGIAISGISAGGSRSAAWSDAGEGWIWGKGIEGLEVVELPEQSGVNDAADQGDGRHVAQIAVGDDYEFVLARDGSVWARGKSTHSSLIKMTRALTASTDLTKMTWAS